MWQELEVPNTKKIYNNDIHYFAMYYNFFNGE